MTLIEKIDNLTWYNNIVKLKEVLKEFLTMVITTTTNKFIPLTGTTVGNPVTGTIETVIDENNVFVSKINNDIVFRLYQSSGDSELYLNLKSPSNVTTESFYTPTSIIFNNSIGSINIKNMSGGLVISSPLNSLFKGLSGEADFSPNITNLDYTQKIYVDTKVSKGVNNPTTTVLTTTQLNAQYSTATTGFRVYCTSITAGSMVYEKTPTQWIGTTVFTP